jgi:hypothetical protein
MNILFPFPCLVFCRMIDSSVLLKFMEFGQENGYCLRAVSNSWIERHYPYSLILPLSGSGRYYYMSKLIYSSSVKNNHIQECQVISYD